MNKKVVLVDMDDVLNNFVETWLKEIEDKYGYHKTSEDITEWSVYKFYPDLEPNYLYGILDDPEFWKKVQPKEDAIRYIPKLQEYFDIYVVTSAWSFISIGSKIINILFKYFPTIKSDHVIICDNKQMIKGDVIIDDGIHNLIGHDAIKLLYDTPHNRNVSLTENMYRVHNWEEIYNWLMGWGLYSNMDTCVMCGRYVPEGFMVCPSCKKKIMGEDNPIKSKSVTIKDNTYYSINAQKICNRFFDSDASMIRRGLDPCWRCPLRNYKCKGDDNGTFGKPERSVIDRWKIIYE